MIEESRMRFISGMLNHTIERQRTLTINDIQENSRPRFILTPVAFVVSGRIEDWLNSNVSYYLSFNTTVSGRIQCGRNCLQALNG